MKKILFLALFAILSCYDVCAEEGQSVVEPLGEGWVLIGELDSNNCLSVYLGVKEGYSRESITGTITFPESIKDYKVTSIKSFWAPNVTEFIIPKTVTSIEDYAFGDCSKATFDIQGPIENIGSAAFYGCSSIKEMELKNVKNIGQSAFAYCTGLTSLTLGNEITTLPDNMLEGCSSLESFIIPESVKTIGIAAFGWTGIKEFNIPESVSSINDYAFRNTPITTLNIPKSVTQIGYGIAAWSPNVTTITVDAANPTYESRNNAIVEKSTNKLIQGCKTTEIPESVTEIFAASFTGMGIEEFVIPKTISKIGNYIFTFNDNLEKVISYIEEPFDVSEEAFCYSKEENEEPVFTSATLYVPVGTLQKYQAAKGWNKFSNIVEMESTGINAINTVDASDAEWFSIDGKRLNAPQKGLNIIREKGKVTRKIIIK